MKDKTFEKYAAKISLKSGNYYFVKKNGTIIDFMYDSNSKRVVSGKTKKDDRNYKALKLTLKYNIKKRKRSGDKDMKDIIEKIKKCRRAKRKRSPASRRRKAGQL